jgi:hypothetical protein
MNVKDIFVNLTQYLVPYKEEKMMEPFLPTGIQKDEVGNYFIIIGESKTMFTCHLDNYTRKVKKVTHVFYEDDKGKKVKTDGKTPLGADAKAGMTIMLYMIENKVPGCYYFFIGEEPIAWSGGCKGSKNIYHKKKDWFKRFDRCVAFDRKGYSSIISSQHSIKCCSKEFVDALVAEFKANGMDFKDDPTGRYTDSAVFMETIPEVTNLSCGYFNEHTNKEFLNIDFLEELCKTSTKINWEKLPIVRDPKKKEYSHTETKPKVSDSGSTIMYAFTAPDLKRRKDKKGINLFGFNSFVKARGEELYEIIRDYLDYYGYNLVKKNAPFIYQTNKFVPHYINAEFKKSNSPPLTVSIRNNVIYTKFGIKGNFEYVGDLKAFEHVFDIGFAAKFYKYVDSFMKDLLDYKKKVYSERYYWKVTDDEWKTRKNFSLKINSEIVEKFLKQYGNFKFADLQKDYDKLFDEDDFIIKTEHFFSGDFTCIYI